MKKFLLLKIRNNPTRPLLFSRTPYKHVLQDMELYDKLMGRLQDLSKESCFHQREGLIST